MLHTRTPLPPKLSFSVWFSASYKQNGWSIVVHSCINSIEPPGSALISHIPTNLWGRVGQPAEEGSHGWWEGWSSFFASGIFKSLGEPGAQYIPFIITLEYGAMSLANVEMYP